MNSLRQLLDRQRARCHPPQGPRPWWWPLFDAFDTFLFAPDHRAPRAPVGAPGVHVRDYADLKRVMTMVIVALLPCLCWAIWNTGAMHFAAWAQVGGGRDYVPGWLQLLLPPDPAAPSAFDVVVFGLQRLLPILVVSYGVGLGVEMMFAVVRGEEVNEGYLVTGLLVALIVPASIPLWQLAVAVAAAVVLGKEVFGGTGHNVFNPALLVRAFLFFAFAGQMSGDAVWVAGNHALAGAPSHLIDGFSAPTPLAVVKQAADGTASAALGAHWSTAELFFGAMPGSAGETSKFAVLLGAFWLVLTGVGSWRVMLAGVLGLLGAAGGLQWALGATAGPLAIAPWQHLLCGGFLFGIVFMATDPVSGPSTNLGRWIYGAAIGGVTMLVRAINPAYPEGTMLAILLLNAFAPGIDWFVVAANIRRRRQRS